MQPDSTSFISSVLHDPQALLELIGVILAVIALLIAIVPKICRWLRNYLDRRSLKRRLGAELSPRKISCVLPDITSSPIARMSIPARKKISDWFMP
jgi:hypothetical protein